ncbi:hypothetical protein ACROYT_G035673 [Oculina patagonica]
MSCRRHHDAATDPQEHDLEKDPQFQDLVRVPPESHPRPGIRSDPKDRDPVKDHQYAGDMKDPQECGAPPPPSPQKQPRERELVKDRQYQQLMRIPPGVAIIRSDPQEREPVELENQMTGVQKYYPTLHFINKAGQDALVHSSNNPAPWRVPKDISGLISIVNTSAENITLTASSADDNQALTLNGKFMTVFVTPQATKGKIEDIVID